MKKVFAKKAVAMSVSFTLLFGHVSVSHAGLKDVLNQMFISSSTSPQSFETQRAFGVYGGNLMLRPTSKPMGVIQFAAPRINAGCGGIDMFFGSFSFINGEQFEQLLRSIAAAAVGYAIKQAIRSMCDSCAAVLQNLEDTIAALNSLAKNTCSTMNAMFSGGDAFGKLKESSERIASSIGAAANEIQDWFSSEALRLGSAGKDNPGNKDELKDENPLNGNLTYRAADYTLGNGANKWSSFVSKQDLIEIIISLFGTQVINPAVYKNGGSGSGCPSGVDAHSCEEGPQDWYPTITSLDHLLYARKYKDANGDGVSLYRCGGQGCITYAINPWPLSIWGGVEDIINLGMFGVVDPESVNPQDYPSDSLLGAFLQSQGTEGLSQRAKFLVEFSPAPLVRSMLELQGNKGQLIIFAKAMAEILPKHVAYAMGLDLVNIASNIFSTQAKVFPPDHFRAYLQARQTELNKMRPDDKDYMEIVQGAVDMIDSINKFKSSHTSTDGGE